MKHSFIARSTKCNQTARPKDGPSRRKKSFSYHFVLNGKEIRVCKQYYLDTVSVSQKVIYNVHEKKNPITGTPKSDGRGKHPKKVINQERKQLLRDHIRSFPVVESHYCRSSTKKQYLESQLNLQKMYDLYKEMCEQQHLEPVKCSFYRHVFNTEFNFEFHKPKSDRCDKCEEYRVAQKEGLLTDHLEASYSMHRAEKDAMREARQQDRDDKTNLVVSFDLENVITCPKAETSCFFYKRKLNVYNLTAHVSKTKQGYCAIWSENTSGRAGNDIASAVIKILNLVVSHHPETRNFITWSDSCVPQNRNSIMSFAITNFILQHQHIESVTMKYSTPGHSCIQEVDNIHSNIEKAMSVAEFYSPVSFIKVLLHANRKSPYKVLQMRGEDFKDYQACSKALHYSQVPYTKVSQLKFTRESFNVLYKTSHAKSDFIVANIAQERKSRLHSQERSLEFSSYIPKPIRNRSQLSGDKKKDLEDMLKYMPLLDRQYYKSAFQLVQPMEC